MNIAHFDQMKDSPFLSWFDTSQTGEKVTIQAYEPVEIKKQNGETERKWTVYFVEKEKSLLLNKTNRNVLSQLFNGDVQGSIGKSVILFYRDDIEMQGQLTKGLRIKACPVQVKPLEEQGILNLEEYQTA